MTDTTDITMPQLSDAMEEGTIVKWLVEDGGEVAVGDELVEIETDKATMAYAAEVAGTLQIVVPEGDAVAVGAPIARVGAAVAVGVGVPAPPPSAEDPASTRTAPPTGAPSNGVSEARIDAPDDDPALRARRDSWFAEAAAADVAARVGVGAGGGAADVAAEAGVGAEAGDGVAVATPVARRYARVHGIALGAVVGSGPRGRIVKNDVLRAAGVAIEPLDPRGADDVPPEAAAAVGRTDRATPASAASPGGSTPSGAGATRQAPTRLQQVIARRMVESKATVPHFQVQTEVAMDEAILLRARLKRLVGEGEKPPSFNDLIVRACAVALRDHPLANGSWVDDEFELHGRVNVGIAVAAEGGLVVPTIFDTDQKSLGQIGAESRRLAAAVRDGSVLPAELSGGTFTVSNLGMYGMTAITPVVNPPQAAILGVGAMRETLVRDGEGIVDRSLLTLTLSCDHRILYGADAALFLKRIKDLLEQPLRLAL